MSEDKSVVHGDVLVEDWPPYIVQWRQRWPNGFVIIPAQPWNADLKALPENSIRYDGSNLNEIRRVLESILKETRALCLPREDNKDGGVRKSRKCVYR